MKDMVRFLSPLHQGNSHRHKKGHGKSFSFPWSVRSHMTCSRSSTVPSFPIPHQLLNQTKGAMEWMLNTNLVSRLIMITWVTRFVLTFFHILLHAVKLANLITIVLLFFTRSRSGVVSRVTCSRAGTPLWPRSPIAINCDTKDSYSELIY